MSINLRKLRVAVQLLPNLQHRLIIHVRNTVYFPEFLIDRMKKLNRNFID